MPWCEPCGRYLTPSAATPEATCPRCGASLEHDQRREPSPPSDLAEVPGGARTGVPWHFWVLLVAITVYLGWRLVQLALWLL